MLKIIHSLRDLDFDQLMQVYEEGNRENGRDNYPMLSTAEQLLAAQQDFYAFLQAFFKEKHAFYAVWEVEDEYKAALRLEPFLDGLLLEALETKPSERRKGYAQELINGVASYLQILQHQKIYSHIHKKNTPSIAVHIACGFKNILPYARYIDGSVLHSNCTYLKLL